MQPNRPAIPPARIRLFLSYAHEDEDLCEQLEEHLYALKRDGLVDMWEDRHLQAGDAWRRQIIEQLDRSHIILLLVSAKFIRSDFCYEIEMERALARHRKGEAVAIPVILRHCAWRRLPPLASLKALPKDGEPVLSSVWSYPDEAFLDIYEGVYRVVVEKLAQFPQNPDVPRAPIVHYNIPNPSTPFVGRRKDLKKIKKLLLRRDVRLLILHGLGGTGKTRLALRAAESLAGKFRNGVCLVAMEPVTDPDFVPSAIAKALKVQEIRGTPIQESLRQYLERQEILLLLDGFEHLVAATNCLADLLEDCPGVTFLVTSRSSFKIDRIRHLTRAMRVKPLEIPPEDEQISTAGLLEFDSIKLFLQSARTILESQQMGESRLDLNDKNVSVLAEICRYLDGHPLAIELAASHIRRYPISRILTKLQQRSSSDSEEDESGYEQLQAAFTWTYNVLSAGARKLFRRLSVFSSGFTPEAVAGVCDPGDLNIDLGSGLWTLLENDLLHPIDQSGQRFKVPDILKEIGSQFLTQRGETERFRRRHAEYFVKRAEEANEKIRSAQRGDWLERLDAEYANIQAALEWALKEDKADSALRLAGALFWFWNLRARFNEGRTWLEEALRKSTAAEHTAVRARALYAAGGLAFLQGDYDCARSWLEESEKLWRELNDARNLGYTLIVLGMVVLGQRQFELAQAIEEESVKIFREVDDPWGLALSLNDLGNVFRQRDQYLEASKLYHESLSLWQTMNDSWGLPLTLSNLGYLEMQRGNNDVAQKALEEVLEKQQEMRDKWGRGETLRHLADLAARQIRYSEAEELYCESLRLNQEIGRKRFIIGCLLGLAFVAGRTRRAERAARLLGAVDSLRALFNVSETPRDQDIRTVIVKDLQAQFETIRLESLQEEGREMDLSRATEYALEACTH